MGRPRRLAEPLGFLAGRQLEEAVERTDRGVDPGPRVAQARDPLGELGPGSFFGEMALIDGGDRSATVRAKTPMSLLVLGRHDFNEMLSNAMPHIAPKLMQCMGQRIRELSMRAGDPLPF